MTAQHLKFAGGEWGGWTSYIVEYAPEGRRGFIGSWQQVSVGSGFLLGSLSAALLSSTLSPDAFMSWGWIRSCSAFSGRANTSELGRQHLSRVSFSQHRLEIDNKRLFEERICRLM
jgi:MFS family permease